MTAKPVNPRERAKRDIQEAVDHYVDTAGDETALGFVGAVARAFDHIGSHPATGSPRHAHELGLPGLRHWPLKRFPYLVFYVERADRVDVLRVLHGRRDIPAWIPDPELP